MITTFRYNLPIRKYLDYKSKYSIHLRKKGVYLNLLNSLNNHVVRQPYVSEISDINF
jgi:hypothetical protein